MDRDGAFKIAHLILLITCIGLILGSICQESEKGWVFVFPQFYVNLEYAVISVSKNTDAQKSAYPVYGYE